MKAKRQMFLAMSGLALLSGCVIGNLTDWADDTFYQSQMYKENDAIVKQYLKGIRLYDQFETVAIFDVLWNSDEVRTAYSRLYAKMMGKNEEGELAFLRRQLSANAYFVSFYVLSLSTIPLTATPPTWIMYMEIDGKRYLPAEVKLTELPSEYVRFFGKKLTTHKQAYEVKFDRKDTEDNDILAGKKVVKMFFSSPHYFGSVGWDLDEQGNVTDKTVLDKKLVPSAPKVTKKQRSLERRAKKKEEYQEKQEEVKGNKPQRSLGKRMHYKKQSEITPDMQNVEISLDTVSDVVPLVQEENAEPLDYLFLEEPREPVANDVALIASESSQVVLEEYGEPLSEVPGGESNTQLFVSDYSSIDEFMI